MPPIITLPDGQKVNLGLVVYYAVAANVLTFTYNTTQTIVYTANSNANALYVQYQVEMIIASGVINPLKQIVPSLLAITSITPTTFDFTTTGITINGSGFSAATVGTIRFEDAAGGFDSNGYYDVCTYVSPTQLTAVYGGPGDYGAPITMIYYKDSLGNVSNALACHAVTGYTISIP